MCHRRPHVMNVNGARNTEVIDVGPADGQEARILATNHASTKNAHSIAISARTKRSLTASCGKPTMRIWLSAAELRPHRWITLLRPAPVSTKRD